MPRPPPSIFDSVHELLKQVKGGEEGAFARLFQRYYDQLFEYAHQNLRHKNCGPNDADDVAQEAFIDIDIGARVGSFKRLESREDLWEVMTLIADRTIGQWRRRETRLKRGGGRKREKSLPDVPSNAPSHELAVDLADREAYLIGLLPTDSLRTVARLILDGESVNDVSIRLKVLPRTISRKLKLIQDKFMREILRQ
jgi:DNA-directed RNA polymerase specialized sigma24 family protein